MLVAYFWIYFQCEIIYSTFVNHLCIAASLGVITNPLGAILSGILMEWLGRKRAVQLVSIPFLIGWIMIAVSQDLLTLCIGRAITGMAIGKLKHSSFYKRLLKSRTSFCNREIVIESHSSDSVLCILITKLD